MLTECTPTQVSKLRDLEEWILNRKNQKLNVEFTLDEAIPSNSRRRIYISAESPQQRGRPLNTDITHSATQVALACRRILYDRTYYENCITAFAKLYCTSHSDACRLFSVFLTLQVLRPIPCLPEFDAILTPFSREELDAYKRRGLIINASTVPDGNVFVAYRLRDSQSQNYQIWSALTSASKKTNKRQRIETVDSIVNPVIFAGAPICRPVDSLVPPIGAPIGLEEKYRTFEENLGFEQPVPVLTSTRQDPVVQDSDENYQTFAEYLAKTPATVPALVPLTKQEQLDLMYANMKADIAKNVNRNDKYYSLIEVDYR